MKPVLIFVLAMALGNLAPGTAVADLGVEKVSRSAGAPGEKVRITLGCGSCAGRGQATASFPVLLVPVDKVPKPRRCGPKALCAPRVRAVPRRAPFIYLGEARLSGGGDGAIQRYVLSFPIPQLRAGAYAYVIYCDSCIDGRAASLITEPALSPLWRLRIRR
jgi:hypothetical protein